MRRPISVFFSFVDSLPEKSDFEDEVDGSSEAAENAVHHRRHQVELE